MNKRGVELTWNVIIVGIILLLVLIVMIAIFSGQMGKNIKKLDDAEISCDGACQAKRMCGVDEVQVFGNYKEHKEGKLCCCPKARTP
jgi:hypothetical protein